MRKVKLDPEEQAIEDAADEFVPVGTEERRRIESIIARGNKNKNVNIRLTEHDLDQIRERAEREGVPYQTLISSVLHKFVNDQLIDEREIIKTLDLIGRNTGN